MPCNSDYMNPNEAEANSKTIAIHLCYLLPRIKKTVPLWVTKASDDYYGNAPRLNDLTQMLCESCTGLTEKQQNQFIYNGRSKEARELANWWDEHQEADRQRIAAQQELKSKNATFNRVWKTLTPAEKSAILKHFGVTE